MRLLGSEYRIHFDLPAEAGGPRASGEIVVRGDGRSLDPAVHDARRRRLGVGLCRAGHLRRALRVDDDWSPSGSIWRRNRYHDHNWGFWEGVRWQWGQVQGDGLSFVYGRVYPPRRRGRRDASAGLSRRARARRSGWLRVGRHDRRDRSRPSTPAPSRIVVTRSQRYAGARPRHLRRSSGDDAACSNASSRGMNFLQLRGTYRPVRTCRSIATSTSPLLAAPRLSGRWERRPASSLFRRHRQLGGLDQTGRHLRKNAQPDVDRPHRRANRRQRAAQTTARPQCSTRRRAAACAPRRCATTASRRSGCRTAPCRETPSCRSSSRGRASRRPRSSG